MGATVLKGVNEMPFHVTDSIVAHPRHFTRAKPRCCHLFPDAKLPRLTLTQTVIVDMWRVSQASQETIRTWRLWATWSEMVMARLKLTQTVVVDMWRVSQASRDDTNMARMGDVEPDGYG
jgi:hypothetical protein